jgi:hypothetical protein
VDHVTPTVIALDSLPLLIVIVGHVLHVKQTQNVRIQLQYVQMSVSAAHHVHFNQNVLNILQGHFATQEHVLGALQTLNAVVHLSQNAQVVIFVLRVNKVLIAHYKQENIVIVALVLHVL